MRGRAHKVLLTNAKNFEFKSMRLNNRDMEWLEGQKWYHHAVFGAYGLSPQEVGFYENSNRSTSEGQERTSVRNAIRPYMKMVADKINREIIPSLIGNDHIIFKWLPRDTAQENTEHRKNMDLIDRGVLSVDEMRSILGYRAQEHTVADRDDNIVDPQDNTLEAVELEEGSEYMIRFSELEGFTAPSPVTGTMGTEDITVEGSYDPASEDETETDTDDTDTTDDTDNTDETDESENEDQDDWDN